MVGETSVVRSADSVVGGRPATVDENAGRHFVPIGYTMAIR